MMTFSRVSSVINFTALSESSQSDNDCLSTLSSSLSLTSEGDTLEARTEYMIEGTNNSESYQLPVAHELLHTPGIKLQNLCDQCRGMCILPDFGMPVLAPRSQLGAAVLVFLFIDSSSKKPPRK